MRQLEQQVKNILDAIALDESRKRELIRGDAVDKAEQLSEFLCQDPAGSLEVLCCVYRASSADPRKARHLQGSPLKSAEEMIVHYA